MKSIRLRDEKLYMPPIGHSSLSGQNNDRIYAYAAPECHSCDGHAARMRLQPGTDTHLPPLFLVVTHVKVTVHRYFVVLTLAPARILVSRQSDVDHI